MNVLFTDNKILSKFNDLIKDIIRSPTYDIGKTAYLKNNLVVWLYLRINLEHRLIYKIQNSLIIVAQCSNH